MNCQKHRFQISDWIGGSLDDESPVKAHLKSCSACSEFFEQQLQLDSLLSSPELEVELPAGIWAAVQARVDRSQEVRLGLAERLTNWITGWQPSVPAYGMAGLAAMVLLSLSLFQLPSGPDPTLMAQLDNYTFERLEPENPFLVPSKKVNPFLSTDFKSDRGNPFAVLGRRP